MSRYRDLFLFFHLQLKAFLRIPTAVPTYVNEERRELPYG